jgi:amino acid transporter
VDQANIIATIVVFVVLVAAVVVIVVRRRRRRLVRRRPFVTRGEVFASIAVIVLFVAIVSHTR